MDYDTYYLDRNCISHIYENYEELGRFIIEESYNLPRELYPYFNYENYGYDVVNEESQYINLVDGRIIEIYSQQKIKITAFTKNKVKAVI